MIGRLRVSIRQRMDGDEWVVVAIHDRPDGLMDSRAAETSGSEDSFDHAVAYVPGMLAELIEEARARA
jgi:hypothetical protein